MRTAGVILAVSFALSAQQPASPSQTFRSGVDVVHVDVSVLDNDRNPVRGLRPDDFVVREDGKVRPIVVFTPVELPPPPPPPPVAWMRDVPPDVVGNQIPREGRLVTIVFDWTVRAEDMPLVKPTAETIVNQLGPGDLAAVIFVRRSVAQNFTADHRLLLSAIDQTVASIVDDDPDVKSGDCYCGVCSLETMTIAAEALRDVPERRKMLVYIGRRVPVASSGDCGFELKTARERLIRAAGVANMTIHSVDAALLQTLAAGADVRGVPSRDRTPIVGGNLQRQGDLSVYPDLTGGRAIQNTNTPQDLVPALFAESQSYYVLGFTPQTPRADGTHHDIKVEVKRKGVVVHPRKGYDAPTADVPPASTAAPGDAPPSLVKAMAGLWPATTVPVEVSAVAVPDVNANGTLVTVQLRAQAVRPADNGPLSVNVLAGSFDRDGKPLSSQTQRVRVELPPDDSPAFSYEIVSQLRLKPGRHEVRVAVEESVRRLAGSAYTYVQVPDFARSSFSLSGAMLGLSDKPPAPGSTIPIVPTLRRRFRTMESVTAFVTAHEGGDSRVQPVNVTGKVVDGADRTVLERETTLFTTGSGRSENFSFEIPLSAFAPGAYLMRIEAAAAQKTTRREIRFEVIGENLTAPTPSTSDPRIILAAAAKYLAQYEKDVSAVVAEETYVQRIAGVGASRESRTLRSDMLVILDEMAGWVGFRDVFEMDGHPVRDRDQRLMNLFMRPNKDAVVQARRVVEESSRYNLNPSGSGINRTINQPFMALKFLRARNQGRSTFRLERSTASEPSGPVRLMFREFAQPRLISSPDNAAAQGAFTIDPATGRVTSTELDIQTGRTRIRIRVAFAEHEKLHLSLPSSMDESYTSVPPIEGHATYSNFRQFNVATETTIK
jgi:VWFA-related protein